MGDFILLTFCFSVLDIPIDLLDRDENLNKLIFKLEELKGNSKQDDLPGNMHIPLVPFRLSKRNHTSN